MQLSKYIHSHQQYVHNKIYTNSPVPFLDAPEDKLTDMESLYPEFEMKQKKLPPKKLTVLIKNYSLII